MCGNETITLPNAFNCNCCNQGTCFKEMNGDVKCQGLKQSSEVPCNGMCKQDANFGETTISCKDQKECVKTVQLCKGVPICRE